MAQRYFVIGLGQFGSHLAHTLTQFGGEVIAIDIKMSLVEQNKDLVSQAICTDASKEENLRAIAIEPEDTAFVSIGEDHMESSILTTALLSQLKVHKIIARATNELHTRILKVVGAYEIINPERDLAKRIAQRTIYRGLLDMIPIADDLVMGEIAAPPLIIGRSLADANIRRKYGITVIAIKHKVRKFVEGGEETIEEIFTHNPHPATTIQENDILMCIGTREDIDKFTTL